MGGDMWRLWFTKLLLLVTLLLVITAQARSEGEFCTFSDHRGESGVEHDEVKRQIRDKR